MTRTDHAEWCPAVAAGATCPTCGACAQFVSRNADGTWITKAQRHATQGKGF